MWSWKAGWWKSAQLGGGRGEIPIMQGEIASEAVPTGTAVPPKLGLEGEAY